MRTEYINTDLCVISAEDLAPLAAALEARGVLVLDRRDDECGMHHWTFECVTLAGDPDDKPAVRLCAVLDAVEDLPPQAMVQWRACVIRKLDVGFSCGDVPFVLREELHGDILGRIAAAGASLAISLYGSSDVAP